MELQDQLIDTWAIHNRVNLYLLAGIAAAAWQAAPAAKGRGLGEQFAHIHNVRLMWFQAAAPELMDGLVKMDKDAAQNVAAIRQSLQASGDAMEALLKKSITAGGKVKGFKPHVTAFLGYLISHESYHRGEIGIILTQLGYPLDKKVSYGLWEWGTR